MQEKHADRLLEAMKKKGWSKKELKHAQKVLTKIDHDTHGKYNATIIWILFAVIIVSNIIVMAVLLPLMVIMPNNALYGLLVVLGGLFGLLFTIIIKDIEHLFVDHHHYFLFLVVPYLSIAGGYLVFEVADKLPNLSGAHRDPLLLGVVYTVAFLIPILSLWLLKWIKK